MSLRQLLFARGRWKHEYFLSALQQFYFLLIFYIETVHSFLHSLLKFIVNKNSPGFAIWQYLSALYFFANSYLFYPVLLLKITLFNTVHCAMGKISRDCDKDVTSRKSWSSRRFLRELGYSLSKSNLDRLIRKEDYVGLPTDSFIGQGCAYDFL